MIRLVRISAAALSIAAAFCGFASAPEPSEQTAKPWAWFWAMGGAMEERGLSEELELMAESGIGGITLIPIYGAGGDEKNYTELLSPRFMELVRHASKECARLGMGFDMAFGSGWPFGGPWIARENSAKRITADMKCESVGFRVKRSAPGGHGYVVDPFESSSNLAHAEKFREIFSRPENRGIVRAFFNDSYEFYGANFTDAFYEEFERRRGYDFRPYAREIFAQSPKPSRSAETSAAPAGFGSLGAEKAARIWQDYHETISDLLLDNMTEIFARTACGLGAASVNQAHGSPGNLIDLYAKCDIPETESFGSSGFKIPLVRRDGEYPARNFGRPNPDMMKFASSAAHISGRKLAAAEACTWLTNHFKTALSQIKPELDALFCAGINHISYNGWTYSPPSVPFPGRLFYATSNFNRNSAFIDFLPHLNRYVYEVQKTLQSAPHDNDVLVYFPIRALWKKSGGPNHVLMLDVHRARAWLGRAPQFADTLRELNEGGFAFDYVSDAFLKEAACENGRIRLGSGNYAALLVPDAGELPIETFRQIDRLAKSGAKIAFRNSVPRGVTGFGNLDAKRAEAAKIRASWENLPNARAGETAPLLEGFGAKPEKSLAQNGISFYRMRGGGGKIWFAANLSDKFSRGKIKLSSNGGGDYAYRSPLTGENMRLAQSGGEFELALAPGESCFLAESGEKSPEPDAFPRTAAKIPIKGEWTIDFLRPAPDGGGQKLPLQIKARELKSWTELGGEAAQSFGGFARYSAEFSLSDAGAEYAIDIGDPRDRASVYINKKKVTDIWCAPFRAKIPRGVLKEGRNLLEIEVANSSFNRIRALAAKNPDWNRANNIFDITYGKFEPEKKPPEPSGLLGEVFLEKLSK